MHILRCRILNLQNDELFLQLNNNSDKTVYFQVTPGYLPPLLEVLRQNRATIAVPQIDAIDSYTLRLNPNSDFYVGDFDWKMNYNWRYLSLEERNNRKSVIEPYSTATMIGSGFAVDRSFFYRIGGFDRNMQIWGGENLDLSFRTWMCHGKMLIVPCSRIFHVFRPRLPYYFPKGTDVIKLNYKRVVDTLWGSYKTLFYSSINEDPFHDTVKNSELHQRRSLLKELKCKNFSWFLKTVAPQKLDFVSLLPEVTYGGRIENLETGQCLLLKQFLTVDNCEYNYISQQLYFENGNLRSKDYCLGLNLKGYLISCNKHNNGFDLDFSAPVTIRNRFNINFGPQNKLLVRIRSSIRNVLNCLTQNLDSVVMKKCEFDNVLQYWVIEYQFQKSNSRLLTNEKINFM